MASTSIGHWASDELPLYLTIIQQEKGMKANIRSIMTYFQG